MQSGELVWGLLLALLWGGHCWGLTEEEKSSIVLLHNALRSQVSPSATDMQLMVRERSRVPLDVFQREMGLGAGGAGCIWDHNPDRGETGENLFLTSGQLNGTRVLQSWYEEHLDYTFHTGSCTPGKMCGHYTQVVWANSNRVGCGEHFCETVEGIDQKRLTFLVCNYYPKGNYRGMKPYVSGPSCSSCPPDHTCVEKLCDAGQTSTTVRYDTDHTDADPGTSPSWETHSDSSLESNSAPGTPSYSDEKISSEETEVNHADSSEERSEAGRGAVNQPCAKGILAVILLTVFLL
ncbi:peptidase inhibitor 16-like [Acipenser ruthenus]|uniref:peptidase inhibitor 16-like n=1 Tax=Acipenser ruthenus TaxID=7906 RepID=UPI0027423EEF|nr:peptidase inhibitor 16-like [Acipenser ruthenus]